MNCQAKVVIINGCKHEQINGRNPFNTSKYLHAGRDGCPFQKAQFIFMIT